MKFNEVFFLKPTAVRSFLNNIGDFVFVENENLKKVSFSYDKSDEYGVLTSDLNHVPEELLDMKTFAFRVKYTHSVCYDGLNCVIYLKKTFWTRVQDFLHRISQFF